MSLPGRLLSGLLRADRARRDHEALHAVLSICMYEQAIASSGHSCQQHAHLQIGAAHCKRQLTFWHRPLDQRISSAQLWNDLNQRSHGQVPCVPRTCPRPHKVSPYWSPQLEMKSNLPNAFPPGTCVAKETACHLQQCPPTCQLQSEQGAAFNEAASGCMASPYILHVSNIWQDNMMMPLHCRDACTALTNHQTLCLNKQAN